MHRRFLALTLVELLIVVTILILLMGLLLPVLRTAKAKAKQASCTSQMRQMGMALNMYRSDQGDLPRTNDLTVLKDSGYVSTKQLFVCPEDVFGGLWRKDLECQRYKVRSDQSYYTPFSKSMLIWNDLLLAMDDNPGVLACRTHGEKTVNFTTAPKDVCRNMYALYDKKVLRLRLDGSVKLVNFSIAPEPGRPGVIRHFSFLKLFTDELLPKRKKK